MSSSEIEGTEIEMADLGATSGDSPGAPLVGAQRQRRFPYITPHAAWTALYLLAFALAVAEVAWGGVALTRSSKISNQASTSSLPPSQVLNVVLEGQQPVHFTLPFNAGQQAGSLVNGTAAILGVDPAYVVLYRQGAVVDSMQRVVDRRNSMRIGGSTGSPTAAADNALTLGQLGLTGGSRVQCVLRPLRGDHIHYAFAIYIHGELVDTIWDQAFVGAPFESEGNTYPQSWQNLGKGLDAYHILQVNPHFGIHTGQASYFGDGFVHVHPGTAWSWFRATEGLGATLDIFLEQKGVAFFDAASQRYPIGSFHLPIHDNSLDINAMTFPNTSASLAVQYKVGGRYNCSILSNRSDGTVGQNIGFGRRPLIDFQNVAHRPLDLTPSDIVIAGNATHTWRCYYWSYYLQDPPLVMEYGCGSLWLHENLGMITMSFERRDANTTQNPPRPPQCMIDLLVNQRGLDGKPPVPNQGSGFYVLGFDGFPYPMPNAAPYMNRSTNALPHAVPAPLQQLMNTTNRSSLL